MPQARLPDINTAFIVYRREAITSWKGQNYDSCLGSINTLNGLLPDKYRVSVSTLDYNKTMKVGLAATCPKCNVEIEDFKSVQIHEVILPLVNNLVSGETKDRIWICTKCNNSNRVSDTKMTQKSFKEPYFLKVVPKPPVRKEGMMDRTRFHINFSSWFWTTLGEIEAQMAQFRDDNWHKQGDLYDFDEDFGDTGEDTE